MKKILFIIIALLLSYSGFSQCTITSLPYSENFSNVANGNIPNCWMKTYYSSGVHQSLGNKFLWFANSKIIITKIDPSIPINTLKLNMDIMGNGRVYVGVMNNNVDSGAFDTLGVFNSTSYTNFSSVELNFSQFNGNGNYIAFLANGSMQIDNLIIQYTPPCTRPFNLTGIVNSNTVDLSWAEGNVGDNAWWVYYKVDTASTKDSIYTNVKPFTVTGLQPMTNYDFWVVTDCGTNNSLNSNTFNVRTHCNTIDTLPYFDDFSTYGNGNTVFPPCWSRSDTSSPFLYVFNSKLIFYFNNNCAVTPQFSSDFNIKNFTMSMSISHRSDGYSLNGAKMYIGVMDSETDFFSFDTVAIFDLPVDVYKDVKVNFNHYTGSGKYIAFRASHHNITNLNIDYTPLCAPPYNIKSSTNSNFTKITWSPGNDFTSSWWVYYKPNSSISFDSVLVNSTSCTLSNLLPNTNYTAYIKTTCNNNISTISSDTIAFKTYCLPIYNLPYVENFNTYGNTFPICWKRHNSTNGNPSIELYSNALYFYYANNNTRIAVTPYFSNNISLNTLMLKFLFKAYYYSVDTVMRPIIIGSLRDIEDMSTFDSITTVYANYQWKTIELNLSKYNFTGNYIAFKHSNSPFSAEITNILIDDIPSCPRPVELKVDSLTANTANISWDLFIGNESFWKVYYKPEFSQTYDSVFTSTNNLTLSNLIPATNYTVKILTICDSIDSPLSEILTFKTDCSTIDTLPFLETFTRTGINAYPTCWARTNVNLFNSSKVYFDNDGLLVSPELNNSINISDLMIRFNASNDSFYFDKNNLITIGVMTDPNTSSTFDSITSISINNLFLEYDVRLDNYVGNGHYIALKTNNNKSDILVDDFLIDNKLNYCIRPDSLVAIQNSVDNLSADLSWNVRDIQDSGYWVCYQLRNSNVIDSVYTTNSYITIQNLLPDTNYSFYLKTFCSIENRFLTTYPISYITPCENFPINVFPYLEDFSSGFNCWILNNNGKLRETNWRLNNGCANYYFDNKSKSDSRLISPAFYFTTNMELNFDLYRFNGSSASRKLYVYFNSIPDTTGRVLLGMVYPNILSTDTPYWESVKFNFPLNSFGKKYLIFEGANYGEIKLDNILIKPAPTCPENYALNILNFNNNSISLNWENSILIPQNWILAYQAIDLQNFNPNSPLATKILISDTSATQIIINGLKQGTEYSFALRPQCDTTWSNKISQYTKIDAQIPYTTDFSDSIDNLSWYISNAPINGWFVSTAVDNGVITGKSLLISNTNGQTNTYNQSITSLSIATRKFVSSGSHSYNLKFDFRVEGGGCGDYFKVFVVDEDTNYVGGNYYTYYSNNYYSTNAVLMGGYGGNCATCPYYNSNDSVTVSYSVQLGSQGPVGTVKKLVFLWFNDNYAGGDFPTVVDNISITDSVKRLYTYDTICQGVPYNFYGQNIDSTGTYTHQFQTSNILDSIIYLNILVKPSYHDTIFADICQGETYNQFGFNDSVSGFYTQNLQTVLGCDSIVNLNLNVHSVLTPSNLILDNISNYIELTWNGDEENYIIYKDSDSLAITNLKVYRDTNVVAGENYCYKIKALTVDCYSDYSSEECMIFSSIGDVNTYNLNVTLYPNPTENKTILRFDGEKENADIHIYDINGKLVKTLKLKAEDDELEINVQGFEKGVYNIRITNSKINIIKKLIII